MLGNTYDTQVCSIARALELVGERWTLLILRNALFAGSTRYRDFQRGLGIATNVLQDRLDGLVEGGIMERRLPRRRRACTEYVLTAKGRDFAPAFIALTEWGDRWAAPDGPPILYRHAACGSPLTVELTCGTHGRVRDYEAITALPGPGMPADRAARVAARAAAGRSRRRRSAGERRELVAYRPGVVPTSRLNRRVRCAWSTNPVSAATSASGWPSRIRRGRPRAAGPARTRGAGARRWPERPGRGSRADVEARRDVRDRRGGRTAARRAPRGRRRRGRPARAADPRVRPAAAEQLRQPLTTRWSAGLRLEAAVGDEQRVVHGGHTRR